MRREPGLDPHWCCSLEISDNSVLSRAGLHKAMAPKQPLLGPAAQPVAEPEVKTCLLCCSLGPDWSTQIHAREGGREELGRGVQAGLG